MQQGQLPIIKCEDKDLENVTQFKCLGSCFNADSSQAHDVCIRIGVAMKRCGELRHVVSSRDLSLPLKLRLYEVAVCSVLTYGCEGWRLTFPIMRMINGSWEPERSLTRQGCAVYKRILGQHHHEPE